LKEGEIASQSLAMTAGGVVSVDVRGLSELDRTMRVVI